MSLLLHCDVIKTPSVQTWFAYFFLSVQPLSTNVGVSVPILHLIFTQPSLIRATQILKTFELQTKDGPLF